MRKEYAQMQDGNLTIEANWNKGVQPARAFKISLTDPETGNVIEHVVSRDKIYGLMFLFGDPDEQEALTFAETSRVKMITRLLKVRARKDMKKGDYLYFPYSYPVTETVYNSFSESARKRMGVQGSLQDNLEHTIVGQEAAKGEHLRHKLKHAIIHPGKPIV